MYNLLVLNNESDFDLISHPLTSQQVYPTTQPLKLSLTIERDWRQSLCLSYLSTNLLSHLPLIAQLTVPQFSILMRLLPTEDLKLLLLDNYATTEALTEIESLIVPIIEWDSLST